MAGATKRGPRGPYAKSEQTRSAILDAALEVFAQGGYHRGSLREVAERVGMSEAGLLHHFPNKSALLAAVLDHRDERTRERWDFDSAEGRSQLQALVELAEYNASTPGVVELFCTLSAEATTPSHPAHAFFVNRYEVTRAMLHRAYSDLAAQGMLADGVDPGAASVTTIALMDGLQVQWLLDRSSVDMALEVRRYMNSLLRPDAALTQD